MRAAQIRICFYSTVFLPPMSTAIRSSAFYFVGALNDLLYIPQTQSLPSWSCGFNLKLVQLVGRFWVFFLSHTAPEFQFWSYLHLCMWVVHWGLPQGCPGGLGFSPVRARCGGGAVAWVTGVLAAPGTQGSWLLGQHTCSRRVWQPVLANTLQYSYLGNPLPDREAWQATVYRIVKSRTWPKWLCAHRCIDASLFFACGSFAPVCVKVAQLLGLWGLWRCQVCRDTDCLHRRSYGPLIVFFWVSCSWQSEGLFGPSGS